VSYSLKRLACDVPGCGRVSEWEFLPQHLFPTPAEWVIAKENCLCPKCFRKMSRKQYADEKAEDMSKRVKLYRQGLAFK
jgi:hypothetical protein